MRHLLTMCLVAALLNMSAVPAHALAVRWTDGVSVGRATVFDDLKSVKVCDWKRGDHWIVALAFDTLVLGRWNEDYRLVPRAGQCVSRTMHFSKLSSHIRHARLCLSYDEWKTSQCRPAASFPESDR
ncbi:hypothetical protein [Nonomuraea insulae]|uniref:Secreted protein n=1 Tax=Nonomuraea insulae TaxID=1616787 RepID=A0ABW1D8B7_9ACTN